MPDEELQSKLELFIFTYNRSKSLEKLLKVFSNGPFRTCRITVLDNCSTDETSAVCTKAQGNFRELRHVRHVKNIGGLANYLRAIELATNEYAWVICDDDDWTFDCEDVIQKVITSEVDLISVGLEGHTVPGKYQGGVRELAENYPFFFEHSLVSTLIWRTSLYTPEIIRKAYDNIYTMFPHFPFLASLVERNCSIYTARQKMIKAGVNIGYSGFAYLRGWLQSVQNIGNTRARTLAYRDVFKGKHFWHILIFSILIERSYRPDRYRGDFLYLLRTAFTASAASTFKLSLVVPLVFMPGFMHRLLWKKYSKYRAAKGQPLPNFDEDR